MKKLKSKIESLLFVSGEDGLTKKQLAFLTEEDEENVREALDSLMMEYEDSEERGIQLKQLAGTYQLVTKEENVDCIQKLVENPTTQSLSQASLEVLAIIAYKQPITRVEIEDIRGVKSERPIHTLSAKGLVQEVGRAEGTGRAILYGTTQEFLQYFGLKDISALPPLPEDVEVDDMGDTDLFMTKFQEAFEG
ncbi:MULTISPECIES: SMC-Scp complex subunit ScpB [Psychrobacillus]|uniref:Segregation and condensation protein B n=1 Tax=Psychrobacillus faecigallinarum TaxID=2762235 RepID=A0ABR8RBI8_9BACI|nr:MULTISPECIES: SMC-Scp complex subunit ScpB [Psychrobacillus]MBD7945152.1 SMC-Scp complex subunit ScpB [Psychrobacillus faecigallinarum]QEY19897.1 SMC-Scp complex subunit ScpB [Psychrobacillus sp. AK 1817]QGM30436.1 SMC-Scp complex subunit ScpB [Bacillus sp. N3536]